MFSIPSLVCLSQAPFEMSYALPYASLLLAFLFFPSLSSGLIQCKSDADCKVPGCSCIGDKGMKLCADPIAYILTMKTCKPCTKNSDCPAAKVAPGCNTKKKVCNNCAIKLSEAVAAKCAGVSLTYCKKDSDCGKPECKCSKNTDEPFEVCNNPAQFLKAVKACKTCSSTADCPFGECAANNDPILGRRVCKSCSYSHAIDAVKGCSTKHGTGNKNVKKQPTKQKTTSTNIHKQSSKSSNKGAECISTEWLNRNNLHTATIRKDSSVAQVLCIPGLPCGTPGHILRDELRRLVTYRQVCEQRLDCVRSKMKVSKITHAMDWSKFKSSDGKFELTSLSAHPNSTSWSPSRIIANLADLLNKSGLGTVNDTLLHTLDIVTKFFAQRIQLDAHTK